MGRLRDDYENPLMRSIASETVDLFGVEDAWLFRPEVGQNHAVKDPLWGEPTTTARYTRYPIKIHFQDIQDEPNAGEQGKDNETTVTIFISRDHLEAAAVAADAEGDLVGEGDVIGFHRLGDYVEVDVINQNRVGWVNDSDKYTGYSLDCVRRDHYVGERKTRDNE